MKILALNAWGGRVYRPLINYILQLGPEMDIFCLQEIFHQAHGKEGVLMTEELCPALNLLTDLRDALPEHANFYHPHLSDFWGLSIFAKKSLPVTGHGEKYIYHSNGYNRELENQGHTARSLQFVTTLCNDREVTVINLHGLWNGQGKEDTDERIEQSQKIISFAQTLTTDYVICGDFNLSPNTVSLKMIEEQLPVRNLIREYDIPSTRTSLYAKENRFADYAFVSEGIKVKKFKVFPDEVSDHCALYLNIA